MFGFKIEVTYTIEWWITGCLNFSELLFHPLYKEQSELDTLYNAFQLQWSMSLLLEYYVVLGGLIPC